MTGARGNDAGAEAEHRDILTAQLRVLGADHPDTLTTRARIAWEISEQGDLAAAEAAHRDVLADLLRALGPDHPSTRKVTERLNGLVQRRNGQAPDPLR